MPRARQGGMRAGTPGTAYPNRTDLAAQPNLPVRVATNQTYGKGQSQLEAQRQVPMGPPKLALAPSPAPGGPTPVSPQQPPGAAPMAPIAPGAFGDMHRPTERPTEPVTAGAPLGPGPGPEAIPSGPANPSNTNLSTMLSQVANQTGSQAIQALAQHAAAAGS